MSERSYNDVWIFIDVSGNKIEKYNLHLLAHGRVLADQANERLGVVIIGSDVSQYITTLEKYKIDDIYICEIDKAIVHDYNIYADILEVLITQYNPNIFIFASTLFGKSISSRVAAKVKTGLTADCTELELFEEDKKMLKQTRPALEGNVMAQIITEHSKPQMATVRKNVINNMEMAMNNGKPQVYYVDYREAQFKSSLEIISNVVKKSNEANLEKANIIIAGGRGIKSKADFKLLEKLAKVLEGKLAVTRAVVDKGWYSEDIMIGQTGKKVHSDIYFAFGISGALQHTVAIESKNIVAINIDKNAPIFKKANYGIVGDCMEVCRSMLRQLEN
mgnify:CR=1 FL=1